MLFNGEYHTGIITSEQMLPKMNGVGFSIKYNVLYQNGTHESGIDIGRITNKKRRLVFCD